MANQRDHKFDISVCTAVLQGLPREMRARILGHATKAAIQPIKVAAKRYAKRSVRTGALRDSITDKVVVYEQRGIAVGLVGPARGYYKKGRRLGKGANLRGSESPSHYAHLVEYGHHVVAPKQGTSIRKGTAVGVKPGKKHWVPAKPFLRPAGLTTRGEQSEQFYRGLDRGINTTRNRLMRAGAHSR